MAIRPRIGTQDVDPVILGRRIRGARKAAGLTQAQLSGPHLSIAYLSRIEAGHRRPSPNVLAAIADSLHMSVDELVETVADDPYSELRVLLGHAEHELGLAHYTVACSQAEQVAVRADAIGLPDVAEQARILQAVALRKTGQPDEARRLLEPRVQDKRGDTAPLRALTVLADCYLILGDGEAALTTALRGVRVVDDRGLRGSPESVELALTLSSALRANGQNEHSVQVCAEAIADAARFGDHNAAAEAYWRTIASERLVGASSSALHHAELAHAALEIERHRENLVRLRRRLAGA